MQTPQTEDRRPERFAAYIAARRFDPPRPLLIRAAGLAEPKDHALDAGAGALKATRYLLSAGFKHVTAIDSSPAPQTVAAELPREQVRFVLSRLENFDYPDRAYEFVNAEFSLPFISAAVFTKSGNKGRNAVFESRCVARMPIIRASHTDSGMARMPIVIPKI